MPSEYKPYLKILTNPRKGRRFAIPDIHGFSQTFQALVYEQIKLQPEDQLFLLGDYIDRGPDSVGVIDIILEWQEADFQVYTIRGNHDDGFLNSYQNYKTGVYQKHFIETVQKEKFIKMFEPSLNLVSGKDLKMLPEYQTFFEDLIYYIELDNFYLVHGGFNFESLKPFEDFYTMTVIRRFSNPTAKTIVHGHQIHELPVIKQRIAQRNNIIPLDNGCYEAVIFSRYTKEEREALNKMGKLDKQTGKLLALNLDTFELLEQQNIG
jgi:serine/threonine protein phosphatase 1